MYIYDDQTIEVSKYFGLVLHEWLDVVERATVLLRNDDQPNPNICHSHDFCDANMAMDEAFQKVVGHSCRADSERDTAIWNAAWNLAKKKSFWWAKYDAEEMNNA